MHLKYQRAKSSPKVFTASPVDGTTRELTISYRVGRPICRKVLKIMFWEVPPADWLIL